MECTISREPRPRRVPRIELQESLPEFAFEQAIANTTGGPRNALMTWGAIGFVLGSLGIEIKTLEVGGATLQSQQDLGVIVPGFIGVVVAYRLASFLLAYGSITAMLGGLRRHNELRKIGRRLNERVDALNDDYGIGTQASSEDRRELAGVFERFNLPEQLLDFADDPEVQDEFERLKRLAVPTMRTTRHHSFKPSTRLCFTADGWNGCHGSSMGQDSGNSWHRLERHLLKNNRSSLDRFGSILLPIR